MAEIDVLFVAGANDYALSVLEEKARRELGLSTVIVRHSTGIDSVVQEKMDPNVAFIHLSSQVITDGEIDQRKDIVSLAGHYLPPTTRRVIVAAAGHTAQEAKRMAILLGGDLIVAEADFARGRGLLSKIISRGRATPDEIQERFEIIEISGQREGQGVWQERRHSMRPTDYHDGYFKK